MIPTEPRSLLGWLVIGFLAGWIAGLLTRGRGFGCLGNVAVGLVGAVIGGYLFNVLGIRGSAGFLWSLVVAVIGAGILLVAANLLRR
ncbi:GlsB/YeaQ/YmgE family stress response membrane protein [Thermomicrobium sp. 4228-Ro]|uniref:GlsB/YeaQ/YmgE family stress response membrane protein n=1 Tax=Thermomicrobium sp. 4228-Ro TaxID=2993937 RepID=UPI002248CE69|nr:GlsB/YeaQ/YmgE family stress response membrane protein [Thermomicrobium sp. 4228-Ro]MCX2727348.1 GlsB/YeaQ/YmgE family stress response membrane protein [Thermomicrobium sp. 4228-Ro]